jgi:hypothetical protein
MVVAAGDEAASGCDDVLKSSATNRDLEHTRIIGGERTPLLEVKVLPKSQLCGRRVVGKTRRVQPVIQDVTRVLAKDSIRSTVGNWSR